MPLETNVKTALNKRPQRLHSLVLRLHPFGIRRRFINVITACNGFIIATLLALSGAKSPVGSHGWFGTDAAQAFTAELKPGLLATFDMPQYPGQQFDARWSRRRMRWR
jgi:hypothetical protein